MASLFMSQNIHSALFNLALFFISLYPIYFASFLFFGQLSIIFF